MAGEPQLNGRIATVIRESIDRNQWTIVEESQLNTVGRKQPDILIMRSHPEPPIVIENEYTQAEVEKDCRNKLGQKLIPELGGNTISTVIGVLTPKPLQNAQNGDVAVDMLRNGAPLQYAAYMGTPEEYTRFPKTGYIEGTVRNLVEFIRPATEPVDIIERAADTLSDGTSVAAKAIIDAAKTDKSIGINIAEKLRQPWPTQLGRNQNQESLNEQARLQTANMAATIIINALAYQQNLDGHQGIKGLSKVRAETAGNRLTKFAVINEFDHILSINFWPIFHVAKELLMEIPAPAASPMLEAMAKTADGIIDAIRHNDIAGTLFQKLIADRKTLKTYYTSPAATTLIAHLAIPDNLDWADPETLKSYTIADYACGSGGIMLAAYQRARELHRLHGGNPDSLHAHMMAESLTACDIMPAGVHLTASLLSSVAPTTPYIGTRCVLFPFGGQRKTDKKGNLLKDKDGNPIKETDGKGNPIVQVGSLKLLDLAQTRFQAVLPPDEQTALDAKGTRNNIEVDIAPLSQSLVAMNPPFTKPTKHAPRNSDNIDPKNPAFAAFDTTDAEQEAMKNLIDKLGKNTISDGNAGLGTHFTAIANNMVKSDGHIALILPTAAMLGGSYDPKKGKRGQTYSWQKLRNLVCDNYNQITVVSIAQPREKDSAFSADSDFADCMVVARRNAPGKLSDQTAHFVNLNAVPESKLAAQETARAIRDAIRRTTKTGSWNNINIGDDRIGFVSKEIVQRNRRWTTVRMANPTLIERLRELTTGTMRLPQGAGGVNIEMTTVGKIAKVGLVHRDITGRPNSPFRKIDGYRSDDEYPMLWNHYPLSKKQQAGKDPQKTLLVRPDSHGEVRGNRHEKAENMWLANATHLHINYKFRFNANSITAAYTSQKSLGGAMWPTLKMQTADMEKALCVWLNSTLGIALYWLESDRGQDGRGGTTITAIPVIPVLDVPKLDDAQIAAAAKIFDDLHLQELLPANEAWRDSVRQELDRRLFTEVLSLNESHVERLDILRRQWCKEPTVTSAKGTGPPN